MELVARDQRAAFEVLMRRHHDRAYGFAMRYLGNPALADEVTQETFLRLWRVRQTYEPRGYFTSFLGQLCLNACRELGRKRSRKKALAERIEERTVPETSADPQTQIEDRETHAAVAVAITKLSAKHKECILLRYYLGMSYEEMSEVLGKSKVALRSRVFQATNKLRSLLEGTIDDVS